MYRQDHKAVYRQDHKAGPSYVYVQYNNYQQHIEYKSHDMKQKYKNKPTHKHIPHDCNRNADPFMESV